VAVARASHGVIYRRAQCGRHAKPDGGTMSREMQEAREEKSFLLKDVSPPPRARSFFPCKYYN